MTRTYSVTSGYEDGEGLTTEAAHALYTRMRRIGTVAAIYEGTVADGKCVMRCNGSGDRIDHDARNRFLEEVSL
jgi:hypothetical protein